MRDKIQAQCITVYIVEGRYVQPTSKSISCCVLYDKK